MGRILVAAVGNTLMGDDGLGVHALEALRCTDLPEHVDTVEAGTAMLDALPDLTPYDKLVVIDAVAEASQSASVVRNPFVLGAPQSGLSLHQMGVHEALALRLLTDGRLPETVIVGLNTRRIALGTELSSEVASKIPELVEAVWEEIG